MVEGVMLGREQRELGGGASTGRLLALLVVRGRARRRVGGGASPGEAAAAREWAWDLLCTFNLAAWTMEDTKTRRVGEGEGGDTGVEGKEWKSDPPWRGGTGAWGTVVMMGVGMAAEGGEEEEEMDPLLKS